MNTPENSPGNLPSGLASSEGLGPTLDRTDLNLLLTVYRYNAAIPGAAFLYCGRSHKRVRSMVGQGLLKEGPPLAPPLKDGLTVFITKAGIDAYNAALLGA